MIRPTIRISVLLLSVTSLALPAQAKDALPEASPQTSAVGAPLLVDTGLVCPGPDCQVTPLPPDEPHAQGKRIVYLNFEGVTLTASNNNEDATNNVSFLISGAVGPGGSKTIAPFSPSDLVSSQGLSRSQIIQYTVDQLYETHDDYNIEFTTTRPTSGTYHMIVFGGSCSSVVGQSSCGGIAHLDCGDFVPSNIVFVFPRTGGGLRVGDLAATASQELAHAFGLSHTLDTSDIMYPSIRNFIPTQYGAGQIPAEDQTAACNAATYQDSADKMMSIIGYRGQDTLPPSVLITEPQNGANVAVGDPVLANIEDDGTITKVDLRIDNVVVASKTSAPWNFEIPVGSPTGQVTVEIRATDNSDNDAGHRVTVFLGNGDEEPCDNGQCPEGFDCIENLCYSADSGALGGLCSGNEQCDSGLCAQSGEEQRCSQTCDEANACPDGFQCIANTACWPSAPVEDEDSSGLCMVGGEAGGRGALVSAGLLLLALLASRRRTRYER